MKMKVLACLSRQEKYMSEHIYAGMSEDRTIIIVGMSILSCNELCFLQANRCWLTLPVKIMDAAS